MAHRFKFHVQHGSTPYRKGTGHLYISDEMNRLELPVETGVRIERSPPIRNVIRCDQPSGIRRPWHLPVLEIDVSRLPIFMAWVLVMLMLPETIPLNWLFKTIGILGGFYQILVVPLTRLVIEFEDDRYVCGEVDGRVCQRLGIES